MLKLTTSHNSFHGRIIWNLWSALQKSTRVDQIDSFTNELIEKNSLKWELKRDSIQHATPPTERTYKPIRAIAKGFTRDLTSIRTPELCLDVRNLAETQLDNILSGILDEENQRDFNHVIRQCVSFHILPSAEVLVRCLNFLTNMPNVETIEDLSEVCETSHRSFFKNNSQLLPFKALALWRCGNVEAAFASIVSGYGLKSRNRRTLREAFRTIANETIGAKSEAVLVSVTRLAEDLLQDFSDSFPIAVIWKNAFSSQWFSDQQLAVELFERHEPIRSMAYKRTSTLCYNFLAQHDTDAVHRLIQLFLQHDGKDACRTCLKMLFNYQYWRRDLRACSEIMQFCLDIDLALPEVETQKLLNLLLDRPVVLPKFLQKSECSKFQYKF